MSPGLRAPPLERQRHHSLHGGDVLLGHLVAEPERASALQLQPRGAQERPQHELWRLGDLPHVHRYAEGQGEERQASAGRCQVYCGHDRCARGTCAFLFANAPATQQVIFETANFR